MQIVSECGRRLLIATPSPPGFFGLSPSSSCEVRDSWALGFLGFSLILLKLRRVPTLKDCSFEGRSRGTDFGKISL